VCDAGAQEESSRRAITRRRSMARARASG
jgi:hypothetical protein